MGVNLNIRDFGWECSLLQKKLLSICSQKSNVALGERLYVYKELELAPFPAVSFGGWGDWEQDPLGNRSWQWRLNWLSFLSYLAAYHRDFPDSNILRFGVDAIASWCDKYLHVDSDYPFEFVWHDHAAALRAEQILLFYFYCRASDLDWVLNNNELMDAVLCSLRKHGEWLEREDFYSKHTNHGLEQARVLLLLGVVFEGAQAENWRRIAIQRIISELRFAFTKEGVHVENSPAYHIFVFKVFINIIKDYPETVLDGLSTEFTQLSTRALEFITHILRPDNHLPPIGDTEQLPTTDGFREVFGETLAYKNYLYCLSGGRQGVLPLELNRVYPESGYAIFRDRWPSPDDRLNPMHLIVKVGCSSRYHHQQDEGHISLYGGGEDWLIDSGLYNYNNSDAVRKYMRSRVAHNVPLVTYAAYDKSFDHRLHAWSVTSYSEAEKNPYVDMALGVLVPVVHNRRVEFDADQKVVVVMDSISSNDHQRRTVTFQWHFPADKNIVVEGDGVIITSQTGNKLLIDFEGERPDQVSVVGGVKGDRVYSCISYVANKYESSQCLRVVFLERASLLISTRFKLSLASR